MIACEGDRPRQRKKLLLREIGVFERHSLGTINKLPISTHAVDRILYKKMKYTPLQRLTWRKCDSNKVKSAQINEIIDGSESRIIAGDLQSSLR